MNMTKREVRDALGLETDVELAAFFGVTKGAVSLWPNDEAIPEGRQWQARALRPDIFGTPEAPAPKKGRAA